GVETPPRCQFIRVIASELSRIYDHLTCCGMSASELGAITVGFYMIEAREMIARIVEALTGARLTVTYVRIGGVKHDLTPDFAEQITRTFKTIRKLLNDCDRLLSRNRIFIDRMSIRRCRRFRWGQFGSTIRASCCRKKKRSITASKG